MDPNKPAYQDPQRSDWIKGFISLALYLAVITASAFLLLVDYWYLWLVIVFGGLVIIVSWHTRSYAYRCRSCGQEFEISFFANLVAPHGLDREGAWSWLKCPHCRARNKATVVKIVRSE